MSENENNDPHLKTWIDPELEARVVAAVLGEASAFELAELERIIAAKPELQIFRRRIEAVHGLVASAVKGDSGPNKLSPERRRKLLEILGTNAVIGAVKPISMPQASSPSRGSNYMRVVIGIAACLFVLALGSVSLPVYSSAQKRGAAAKALIERRMRTIQPQELVSTSSDKESPPARMTGGSTEFAMNRVRQNKLQIEQDIDSVNQLPPSTVSAPASSTTDGANSRDVGFAMNSDEKLPIDVLSSAVHSSTVVLAEGKAMNSASAEGGYAGGQVAEEPADKARFKRGDEAATAGAKMEAMDLASAQIPAEEQTEANPQRQIPMDKDLPAATMDDRQGGDFAKKSLDTLEASRKPVVDEQNQNSGRIVAATPLSDGEVSELKKAPASAAASDVRLTLADTDTKTKPAPIPGLNSLVEAAGGAVKPAASLGALGMGTVGGSLPQAEMAARLLPTTSGEPEVKAAQEPFSTFSLHVSDVSFLLAQAALAKGQLPDPGSIRPEEFYNSFDYGDPGPATGEKISCHIEQSTHPFLQQRNLVRIAMKVAATGRGGNQPLRLTVLLDTSGSMEREDRAASVRRAMEVLAGLLGPNDSVTLIGFARQPRLLADQVRGTEARKLVEIIAHTPSEGGTNLEEALKLAGQMALRHRVAAAQNRIVLLTDGAANLGDANPDQLGAMIDKLRQQGIAFDACGVGAEGFNDEILEALTRKGDGRYYFLNTPEDADAGFARQLAGALHPAAQNVKMQVRFNPARVGNYRLIGFEKHRLNTEDFRNDKIGAAELAAEEAAVAVYQVEVLPEGEGELGDVFVRFRDPADGNMVERSWTMSYDEQTRRFDQASPSMQLAASAAFLAEKLRGGRMADFVDLDALTPVLNRLRGYYAPQERVQALITMFGELRRMEAKPQ